MEPRKNQLLILKAMASGSIDLPLVIAGKETAYMKTLQQYAREHGLEKRVIWLPNFPDEALPALYQSATVFVFPSLYEGFGIPIVEALVSGLPVIAATGSCLEESGGPGSLYIDPRKEDELADGITALLDDEGRRKDMIAKGLEHARQFSDSAIHQRLNNIYKNLIS